MSKAKITRKYNTNLNKSQRLNYRRQNKARFLSVRYNYIMIILKTEGLTGIAVNELWRDIKNDKIALKVSEYTTYMIGLGQAKKSKEHTLDSKVTVTLSTDTYNLIKLSCLDAIRLKKSIPLLIFEWNKINGFNGWGGINKQKFQLKEYLAAEVCRNFGLNKKNARKLLRVNTYRVRKFYKNGLNQATELPVAKATGHKP